ncbi:MAG TPA: hypothetical protein VFX49_05475 [Chloroflexota bacterium]|nr:hypothetical protein [Chloroflexota bacterium]
MTLDRTLLAAMHLAPRTGDDLDTCQITLTKRQLAFLVDAIEHYEAACCPLKGGTDGCQLLAWVESAATGAIETLCPDSCLHWRDALIGQVAPAAFPLNPLPKER